MGEKLIYRRIYMGEECIYRRMIKWGKNVYIEEWLNGGKTHRNINVYIEEWLNGGKTHI